MDKVKKWNYKVIKKIGAGGYGVFYQCRHRETREMVTIRMITIEKVIGGVPSNVIREVSLLKDMEHDNIIRLLNVLNSGKYVYLVFECLDLDLQSFIKSENFTMNFLIVKAMLKQILLGLAYCHSLKVLHRDLTPKNILIDLKSNTVKLADFGLARAIGVPLKEYSSREVDSSYKAPELLLGSHKYSTPIDMWAVGCIFAEIITGMPLFPCSGNMELLRHHSRLLGITTEETGPGLTPIKCLPLLPQHEPLNLAEVLHDLEPAGLDLLSRMLCLDPRQRITANDALQHEYFNNVQNVPFISHPPSHASCHCFPRNATL